MGRAPGRPARGALERDGEAEEDRGLLGMRLPSPLKMCIRDSRQAQSAPKAPSAPDDDPEFLFRLERDLQMKRKREEERKNKENPSTADDGEDYDPGKDEDPTPSA